MHLFLRFLSYCSCHLWDVFNFNLRVLDVKVVDVCCIDDVGDLLLLLLMLQLLEFLRRLRNLRRIWTYFQIYFLFFQSFLHQFCRTWRLRRLRLLLQHGLWIRLRLLEQIIISIVQVLNVGVWIHSRNTLLRSWLFVFHDYFCIQFREIFTMYRFVIGRMEVDSCHTYTWCWRRLSRKHGWWRSRLRR